MSFWWVVVPEVALLAVAGFAWARALRRQSLRPKHEAESISALSGFDVDHPLPADVTEYVPAYGYSTNLAAVGSGLYGLVPSASLYPGRALYPGGSFVQSTYVQSFVSANAIVGPVSQLAALQEQISQLELELIELRKEIERNQQADRGQTSRDFRSWLPNILVPSRAV
jgi:hypothetical protein